jgi:hypothetical protein
MRRFTSRMFLFATLLGCATTPTFAAPSGDHSAPPKVIAKGDTKKAPPAKADPKAKKDKPAPPKKSVVVTAENKKKLADLYAGFKFGMSKDEVLGVLGKKLDDQYADKLKNTTDVTAQDRLRKEKKTELARVNSSYTAFEGKRTGWDVSIIEEEFAHNTSEAMLERWENQEGKNQRRFFFFYEGKLWKMFVSLDVSILPEDKKNFDTFQTIMTSKYGAGDVESGRITWHTDEFDVRAVDHLKTYDALGLVIEDPKVKRDLLALRESKAPPKAETSAVIKAVLDTDHTDKPDVKQNNNAVDAVIKAQGGGGGDTTPTPKTPPKKK